MTNKRKIEILREMKKLTVPFLCIRIHSLRRTKKITVQESTEFEAWFQSMVPANDTKWAQYKYWAFPNQIGDVWWDFAEACERGDYKELMWEKRRFLDHLIKILQAENE